MNAITFVETVRDSLPKSSEHLIVLKDRLEKMSQEQQDEFYRMKFPLIELKNPSVMLIINFFFGLFGVARFMIGDNALGGLRLVLTSIPFSLLQMEQDVGKDIVDFFAILFVVNFFWWLIDLYFLDRKVRKQNLNKILQFL